MISKITASNFKIFGNPTAFENLKKVNILTGVNGRGKSTFLQTLLLPAQSVLVNPHTTSFILNDGYVSLGTSHAVRNEKFDYDSIIELGYQVGDCSVSYKLEQGAEGSQVLAIKSYSLEVPAQLKPEVIETPYKLLPSASLADIFRFAHIQYVSADRIGPQLSYQVSPHGTVGARGEYAPSVLHFIKSKRLEKDYIDSLSDYFPNLDVENVSVTVGDQVEFWMSKMFGDTKIKTELNETMNLVSLLIKTEGHSDYYNPTNVGVGYSYVLPIIVAGLAAVAGDTIIIENPEAHLHPSAQSLLSRFIAAIAERGVQVFVETHSEHILNTFRVMTVQDAFLPEDVNIMFFDNEFENYYKHIDINKDGSLEDWPPRFFDQAEKDMILLVGF